MVLFLLLWPSCASRCSNPGSSAYSCFFMITRSPFLNTWVTFFKTLPTLSIKPAMCAKLWIICHCFGTKYIQWLLLLNYINFLSTYLLYLSVCPSICPFISCLLNYHQSSSWQFLSSYLLILAAQKFWSHTLFSTDFFSVLCTAFWLSSHHVAGCCIIVVSSISDSPALKACHSDSPFKSKWVFLGQIYADSQKSCFARLVLWALTVHCWLSERDVCLAD